MKKTLTAAMALVMSMGALGVAGAASAQDRGRYESYGERGDGWDRDRYDDRWDRYEDRRDDRWERRQERRERAERRRYERWQRAQRRYAAGRYYAPRGYQTRSWGYGERMPYAYRTNQYVISDYDRYGLYAPPSGYQYVRSGNDVVLAAVASGLITAVISGLFQ